MGHRIELGEIEANVAMLPPVRMAACIYDTKKARIVLYYVGETGEKELAAALRDRLPRYMMPNRILRTEELPFTANGKIDRIALKKQYEG